LGLERGEETRKVCVFQMPVSPGVARGEMQEGSQSLVGDVGPQTPCRHWWKRAHWRDSVGRMDRADTDDYVSGGRRR
jgi:hypothetical protein